MLTSSCIALTGCAHMIIKSAYKPLENMNFDFLYSLYNKKIHPALPPLQSDPDWLYLQGQPWPPYQLPLVSNHVGFHSWALRLYEKFKCSNSIINDLQYSEIPTNKCQVDIPNLIALKTRRGSSKKVDFGGKGVAIKPTLKSSNPVKKNGLNHTSIKNIWMALRLGNYLFL